jgi:hypothetical protein
MLLRQNAMKIIAVFLFTVVAPALAAAQQASNNSAPCLLSHWSTTGAACDYAPDLPPTIDAGLKKGISRSKDGTYYGRPLPTYSKPLFPREMPLDSTILKSLPNSPDLIIQPKLWKPESK